MSMTHTEKHKLAARLVDLTMKDKFPGPLADGAPENRQERRRQAGERFMQLWTKIYAKHYSDEQLLALLNFYESDIGLSILEAQPALTAEFSNRIAELNSSSVSNTGDAPKLVSMGIRTIRPNDKDT